MANMASSISLKFHLKTLHEKIQRRFFFLPGVGFHLAGTPPPCCPKSRAIAAGVQCAAVRRQCAALEARLRELETECAAVRSASKSRRGMAWAPLRMSSSTPGVLFIFILIQC